MTKGDVAGAICIGNINDNRPENDERSSHEACGERNTAMAPKQSVGKRKVDDVEALEGQGTLDGNGGCLVNHVYRKRIIEIVTAANTSDE